MPDWSVQRRYPRHPVVLSIFYKLKGSAPARAGAGKTRDLSEGGACLELAEPLPLSTALSVVLQTNQGGLGMEAEVVWVGGPGAPGGGMLHGVAFTQVSPEQHRALQSLVQRKGQVRHLTIRVPVKLAALCRLDGEAGPPLQGETGEISRQGMLLCLPQALPVAAAVEITLPTPRGPLMVQAAVVWVEPPEAQRPGKPIHHGLRFRNLGWTDELTLGLLLEGAPEMAPPPSDAG